MVKRRTLQARVDPGVAAWWLAQARLLGYMHRGKPNTGALLTAISKGEYAIVKTTPKNNR